MSSSREDILNSVPNVLSDNNQTPNRQDSIVDETILLMRPVESNTAQKMSTGIGHNLSTDGMGTIASETSEVTQASDRIDRPDDPRMVGDSNDRLHRYASINNQAFTPKYPVPLNGLPSNRFEMVGTHSYGDAENMRHNPTNNIDSETIEHMMAKGCAHYVDEKGNRVVMPYVPRYVNSHGQDPGVMSTSSDPMMFPRHHIMTYSNDSAALSTKDGICRSTGPHQGLVPQTPRHLINANHPGRMHVPMNGNMVNGQPHSSMNGQPYSQNIGHIDRLMYPPMYQGIPRHPADGQYPGISRENLMDDMLDSSRHLRRTCHDRFLRVLTNNIVETCKFCSTNFNEPGAVDIAPGVVSFDNRRWYHMRDEPSPDKPRYKLSDSIRKWRSGHTRLIIRRSSADRKCIWVGVFGDTSTYTTANKRVTESNIVSGKRRMNMTGSYGSEDFDSPSRDMFSVMMQSNRLENMSRSNDVMVMDRQPVNIQYLRHMQGISNLPVHVNNGMYHHKPYGHMVEPRSGDSQTNHLLLEPSSQDYISHHINNDPNAQIAKNPYTESVNIPPNDLFSVIHGNAENPSHPHGLPQLISLNQGSRELRSMDSVESAASNGSIDMTPVIGATNTQDNRASAELVPEVPRSHFTDIGSPISDSTFDPSRFLSGFNSEESSPLTQSLERGERSSA